jgi:hypothetical protein
MPPQAASWTCSACSLAWVLRATAANTDANETNMVEAIGYPQNINSTYGLMDGSGSQLRRVLTDYDFNTEQGWLTYDQVYSIADNYVGLMSGGAWYHWVALRGRDQNNLWIANSAPGYMGVWDILSRQDFQRLGPFSVVWIPGYL